MPGVDETSKADIFHKRAQEDYSQFSQHLRMSLQFIFAANGGAALAMLSCLTSVATSKEVNPLISIELLLSQFAWSALFYLGGVFSAVLSLYAFSMSKQNWGHFWEDNALSENVDFKKHMPAKGNCNQRLASLCCLLVQFFSSLVLSWRSPHFLVGNELNYGGRTTKNYRTAIKWLKFMFVTKRGPNKTGPRFDNDELSKPTQNKLFH